MYKLFKLMEAKGEIPPEPYPGAYGRPPDPTYQEFCQQFYGEPSSREYRSPPNLETSQKMRQLLEAVREGKTIVYHEIRSEPRVYTKEQLVDLLVQRADLLSLRGFSRSSEIVYVKDQKEVKVEEESNHNLDYLD
jgi:hypothetical protein